MFDKLRNLLQVPTAPPLITWRGHSDTPSLPSGFFRVITADGKESLGYYDVATGWSAFKVGKTVQPNGGAPITRDKPVENLPMVRLSYQSAQPGLMNIGTSRLVDTDVLDDFDGETQYDGTAPTEIATRNS